ncbi:MAG: hypothetical protein QGG09_05165 [Pirellulaceae bacterium]|nr:hypothetical protein [Pirellulaceae bacterium]HJN08951.1 hypothetical protein [Pirellulaceae bacterium]
MGLFDGALPTSSSGSTAEVSSILDAPVLLVASARGVSRSFAATIKGFSEFEKDCHVVGVLANDCGSKHHADILDEALASAKLCGLTGWPPKGSLPQLPSRHLGLNTPQKAADAAAICNELADAVEQGLDIEALLGDGSRRGVTFSLGPCHPGASRQPSPHRRCNIGGGGG